MPEHGEWWFKDSDGRHLFVRVIETVPVPSEVREGATTTALLEYHAGARDAEVALTKRFSTPERARLFLEGRQFHRHVPAQVTSHQGDDVV